MGEDEELEVLVGERELLEALERLRQRRRCVDAAERERGHAAHGDLGDHPKRAQPDARGAEDLRVALRRADELRAVGEHERELAELR